VSTAEPNPSSLVFVSYSDEDRDRVLPLVQRFRRRRWTVWWDRDNRIGEVWRELIDDRLRHARCVVVVWTRRSVTSRYVQEEAEEGAKRGVLVPLRLDAVAPPFGFRSFQYADLARWRGGRHPELNKLVRDVAALLAGAVEVRPWASSLENGATSSTSGVEQARHFLSTVRAQSAMFKRNPAAAQALSEAFAGVGDTYDAVNGAIDRFAAPLGGGRGLTLARYRPLATGELQADIEKKRGHCTQIGQAYVGEGGLRDSLPRTTEQAAVDELDRIFLALSRSDGDLFKAMGAVGDGLEKESGVLVNMLLAGQTQAAGARLQKADRSLRPLVRQLNDGKRELNRLAGELGVVL
jgi:TIR domain